MPARPGVAAAELLRQAGVALYRAKEEGGGRVQVYRTDSTSMQRPRLEAELREAIERRQLELYYQPVVDVEGERVIAFEALVRWRHPVRGVLLPGEFVEFAQEVGLWRGVDRILIDQAATAAAAFQRVAGDIRVSVNVSDDALLDDGLEDHVRAVLAREALAPASLRLELLERVVQVDRIRERLHRLRHIGVGLYIDDFGTGYSSLGRLHELPVAALKIDRELVLGMSLTAGGDKVVGAIVALARSLGLDVIAEGASTADEVLRLQELGCRSLQGFFFSRALPFDDAVRMLADPAGLRAPLAELAAARQRRGDLRGQSGQAPLVTRTA